MTVFAHTKKGLRAGVSKIAKQGLTTGCFATAVLGWKIPRARDSATFTITRM